MKTKTQNTQASSPHKSWLRVLPYVAGAGALAGGIYYARHWYKRRSSDHTAVSAVTGGPPEDMNAMPPTEFPAKEGPVYDGSQLAREQRTANAPRNAFREPT